MKNNNSNYNTLIKSKKLENSPKNIFQTPKQSSGNFENIHLIDTKLKINNNQLLNSQQIEEPIQTSNYLQ